MRLLCSLLVLLGFCASASAAELRDLRVWDSPEGTRVVFELSAQAEHKVFTLENPPRIVVDLPETHGQKLANRVAGKGVVQHVRAAEREDGGLRVVLDMSTRVEPHTVVLEPTAEHGHRLILDLSGNEPAAVSAAPLVERPAEKAAEKAAEKPVERAPEKPSYSASAAPAVAAPVPVSVPAPGRPLRPIVVSIDAGHGGEDPGAIGHGGVQEKDVCLAMARRLARQINEQPGFKAVLTRDADIYLPLRERTNRARKAQADLFVSIHANAVENRAMRGSAVYVVSPRGATSEHARWLANKENSADLVGGIELENKDNELAAVLIDLSQSSTMEASFDVGGRMLKALGSINHLQKTEVQQAGFMVLKSPDIPSVLVETAFITNAQEERMLSDPDQQERIARSLLEGIQGYFQSYRPRDPGASPGAREPLTADAGPAPRAGAQDIPVSTPKVGKPRQAKPAAKAPKAPARERSGAPREARASGPRLQKVGGGTKLADADTVSRN